MELAQTLAQATLQNNVQEMQFIGMIHAEISKIFISNVPEARHALTRNA
jgi:hypothetical protein